MVRLVRWFAFPRVESDMWNFQGMKPHSFLLSKTQSLSLLSAAPESQLQFHLYPPLKRDTWSSHRFFFLFGKKTKRSPTEIAKQKRQPTIAGTRSRLLQAPQRQPRCRAFWWWTWRGSYPQAADPWHGTSDQLLVYKRLSSDSCLFEVKES